MPFLITGATGDVGSRVVGLLVERGERPPVFVRDSAKKAINSHPKTDDYQSRISRQIDGTPFHTRAHNEQLDDSHHAG